VRCRKPLKIIIRFGGPTICMYCGSSNPPKVHITGAVMRDGEILEHYAGAIHEKCIAPMKAEKEQSHV